MSAANLSLASLPSTLHSDWSRQEEEISHGLFAREQPSSDDQVAHWRKSMPLASYELAQVDLDEALYHEASSNVHRSVFIPRDGSYDLATLAEDHEVGYDVAAASGDFNEPTYASARELPLGRASPEFDYVVL
jgi:hypothetical protein